jgi:hypothetical protein
MPQAVSWLELIKNREGVVGKSFESGYSLLRVTQEKDREY